MKELSIEQKAQRYDEAIERARYWEKNPTVWSSDDICQKLFPELKKSEDERIRKALIRYHKSTIDIDGIKGDKIVSWLEKQGEPVEINPTEFDTRLQTLIGKFDSLPKEELIGSLSFWLNVVQNNGTYKPAKKQGKQKFAKNIVETWKDMRLEVYQQASGNRHESNCSDDTTKMFSLNDIDEIIEKMSEQKPAEWSEEDETYLEHCITAVKNYYTDYKGKENPFRKPILDFLKSLKDRYTWKPSDEQMKALNFVINLMASSASPAKNDYYYNVFKDLRKQLKKLMEE